VFSEILIPLKTLPKALRLENFATGSRWCGQQNSSTAETVDYTYDGRANRGRMHKVNYMLVNCNPLTSLLRFVRNLLYNLFLHCCSALDKILPNTSRRARSVCIRCRCNGLVTKRSRVRLLVRRGCAATPVNLFTPMKRASVVKQCNYLLWGRWGQAGCHLSSITRNVSKEVKIILSLAYNQHKFILQRKWASICSRSA